MNLSTYVSARQGAATTTAGTSAIDGDVIDMAGFDSCMWIAKFGTPATNNTLKVEQGTDATLTDGADLAGSTVAVGVSDEIVWLDLYRPSERWVRAMIARGTSTTLDWCVAIRYNARRMPVDNTVAGTIAGELHVSPAEGTA